MWVLAVNVGSSSLKIDLWRIGAEQAELRLEVSSIGSAQAAVWRNGRLIEHLEVFDHDAALCLLIKHLPALPAPLCVGHRVVHGGGRQLPVWIDDYILTELHALVPLSPLHLPNSLQVIELCRERFSQYRQCAVFDTSFHAGLPDISANYALPAHWRELGIRRYGFHGIACADVVEQLASRLANRSIILHLGAGCSATAVLNGRSVDTSMGFTPLEGLVMATRSGDIDPGILFHVGRTLNLSLDQLEHTLQHESGLLGLSGLSADMQILLATRDDPAVAMALACFCYRAAKCVAALMVALGGLELLVFSGGIGEHAAWIRARIVEHLGWLGVVLDDEANGRQQSVISSPQSRVEVRVVKVDEGRAIARSVAGLG